MAVNSRARTPRGVGRTPAAGASRRGRPIAPLPRLLTLGLEVAAHAVAQLAGRLLGERDGGDGADAGRAGGDQVDDAAHQLAGLAGSGAGLDEEGLVERRGDAVALRLVGGSHAGTSAGSDGVWAAEVDSGSTSAA